MAGRGLDRDTRQIIEQVEALEGWLVQRTRSSHLRITGPNGALIFAQTTSGGGRGDRNLRSLLRRAGAPV